MHVTYAWTMRYLALLALLPLVASGGEIYTRDGVTDGDTFYLAPRAWADDDPVLQAWVAYSLMKSTCQLEMGGDNPARNSDYGCEFTARQHLLDAWEKQCAEHEGAVGKAMCGARGGGGSLPRRPDPGPRSRFSRRVHGPLFRPQTLAGTRRGNFLRWQRKNLRRHNPQTRLIGSWNYAPRH
jgi:hypothetical protein